MAELPTKEELEQLYHEKGHGALVWYAWRNALRASPSLGALPLRKTWIERTVYYSYATLRPLLLLAQWQTEPVSIPDAATARAVARVNARTEAAADDALAATRAATSSSAATRVATIAARVAVSPGVFSATVHARATIDAAEAATADLTYLWKQSSLFNWFGQPLWSKKPNRFVSYERNLLKDLNELSLEFLANDLQSLWEGKPLGDHAENYFQSLSESITHDPKALRRAILYSNATEDVSE